MTDPGNDALLPRIASGDEHAVQEAIRRYGSLVWSMARRLLHDRSEAEDAVQEIFIELWRVAERFDAERSSEPSFVAMVARRRLIDRGRRMGRRREVETTTVEEPMLDVPDPRDGGINHDVAAARAALAQLRPEQRRVLTLALFGGYSQEEIATASGMPLGTVKTHARRGLIRVRELLGHPGVGSGREERR